jgi:glycosyltransferase involved in cell wall biosynthesis
VRLAVLAASPIHYQVPLYRRIAKDPRIEFTAIFASSGGVRPHDAGYGKPIAWDADLLSGYRSHFLRWAEQNPIGGGFFKIRGFDIIDTLLERQFDVLWIHGYNFLTHQLAAITQLLQRRTILFREEQTLLHGRPLLKRVVKALWLRLLFSRSLVLYIGSENRQWFKSFRVPDSRMFFAPYCVDNERFALEAEQLASSRSALRASFGLPDESIPVVLMCGRLIPKKQPLLLLEAFRRVRQQMKCALMIVGSGELEASIRARVSSDKIPDVVLAGFLNQTQISRAYAAADLFVLPSGFHETWGIVVNEAMNFSLPVIVTDRVGCARDLVQVGRNGFVVSAQDPAPLAEAIAQLVIRPTLRRQFGAASRDIVQDWNYDRAAAGVIAATARAVGADRWDRACRLETPDR